MNSLLVATNVVLPLLIYIAVGYTARLSRWVSGESFSQMNKLVFNVLLPCVLFENVYSVTIGEIVNPEFIAFGVGAALLLFACGIPIACLLTRESAKRGVVLQAIFRSNFVLYGFPIVQSLYERERLGAVTLLVALIIPIFNVISVIALEMFRSGKISVIKIITGVIKNPMIIGAAAGMLCAIASFDIPQALSRSLSGLTAAATPVSLIVLGGTFQRQTLGGNKKLLIQMASLKLLIVPAIFLFIAVLLGFRDVELLTFVALFGSPAAVSSFSMSQQMGADSDLAGQNLLITTVFSILTIFMWVSLLNRLAFII